MSSSGALEGSYSTLGWGQLVTEAALKPALEFTYEAYISPQVFTLEAPSLVIHIESNTEESPVPYGDVPSAEALEMVKLTFGDQEDGYANVGYFNYTHTFEIDAKNPQCSFTVQFSRNYVEQKLGTLETGLSVSWFLTDGYGNPVTDIQENSTQILCNKEATDSGANEKLEPVTRWFNIFHHYYSIEKMEVKPIWELVRKIKTNWLWKEDAVACDSYYLEETLTNYAKANLKNDQIADLLNEFDEGSAIDGNVTLSRDDLPSEVWMEGFRMFLTIAYCPSSQLEEWSQFYESTLKQSPPRRILQKVAQILNRKVTERSDTSTEAAMYEMLSKFLPFKAAAATIGLSSDKELLGQLDSPVLGSLKNPLVGRKSNFIISSPLSGELPPGRSVR